MPIVTSAAKARSDTARALTMRGAPIVAFFACFGSACVGIDRDPPQYPNGLDSSTSFVAGDAGDASLAADASTGDASLDAATDGGGSPGAPALDAGGGDAMTDAALSAVDAAPDATIEPPRCAEPAPSGPGCFACTHQGWVEGAAESGTCMYLGVPYAKPPVGPLRFAAPEPAESWPGVRRSDAFGAACVQGMAGIDLSGAETKSENCLFVNVWTPNTAPAGPLPVMVFIHGGGFTGGATNTQSGIGLVRKGPVVVVSMNYRLGALGFFAHPDLDATRAGAPSGSDGIRDQQLALRWVRNNIASFHGDPNNVTVFGESAGSSAVCVHVVSPGSRDLARRFILESGVCTRGVANGIEAIPRQTMYDLTRRMADALCPDAADKLACLRGLPPETLMQWAPEDGGGGAAPALNWAPVIEGAGGVLPDHPNLLIERGEFHRGELIMGTNRNEYGLFQLIPTIFSIDQLREAVESQFGERTDQIMPLYASIAENDPNQAYVTLMTDVMFRCATRSFARMLSSRGSRVYLYSFDEGSAWHSEELGYVFGSDYFALGLVTPVPALSDAMQGYWTSFALDGDPNGGSLPAWPAYALSDQHLTLADPIEVGAALQREACDFWDSYLTSR